MLATLLLLALAQPPVALVADADALHRSFVATRRGHVVTAVLVAPQCKDCEPVITSVRETARANHADVVVAGWGPSAIAGLDVIVTDPAKLAKLVDVYEPDLTHPVVAVFHVDSDLSYALRGPEARDAVMVRASIIAAWLARVVTAHDEKLTVTPPGIADDRLPRELRDFVRKCAHTHLPTADPKAQSRIVHVHFTLPMPGPPSPDRAAPAPGASANEIPAADTKLSRCAARFPKAAAVLLKQPATPIEVDYTVRLEVSAANWPKEWNGVAPK